MAEDPRLLECFGRLFGVEDEVGDADAKAAAAAAMATGDEPPPGVHREVFVIDAVRSALDASLQSKEELQAYELAQRMKTLKAKMRAVARVLPSGDAAEGEQARQLELKRRRIEEDAEAEAEAQEKEPMTPDMVRHEVADKVNSAISQFRRLSLPTMAVCIAQLQSAVTGTRERLAFEQSPAALAGRSYAGRVVDTIKTNKVRLCPTCMWPESSMGMHSLRLLAFCLLSAQAAA